MKSKFFAALVMMTLGLNASASVCVSHEGAQLTVEGQKVLSLTAPMAVTGEYGVTHLYSTASGLSLGVHCESQEQVWFNAAKSQVVVQCPGHTGVDYFVAAVSCK